LAKRRNAAGMEIKGTYSIEKTFVGKDRIPTLLFFHKKKNPTPVVMCIHGWTGNKESMLRHCVRVADAGFLAVAVDARMHGERIDVAFCNKTSENFARTFYSVVSETAADLSQAVDYLVERPDVDPNRVGLMGVSMGGFVSLIATQLEKRVKVVASVLGAGDFEVFGERVSSQKVLPYDQKLAGHLDEETEKLIRNCDPLGNLEKFPPTTLLLMGGSTDPLIPKEGIVQLHEGLKPLYASSPGNLKLSMYDVGHEYTQEMEAEVVQWFTEHL